MAKLWFGGSFNPIHHAHLIAARAVAEARGYERVVLVPSFQPPHKLLERDIAPAEDRLAMCRLAVAGSALFEVDDLELRRGGPSFTIDTVRELKRRGNAKVHWLIGADMVNILPQWHEAAALMAEATIVVMARPGWECDWERLPAEYQKLKAQEVPVPPVQMSATQIRNRVRRGLGIEYLTPEGVVRYIRDRGLYR